MAARRWLRWHDVVGDSRLAERLCSDDRDDRRRGRERTHPVTHVVAHQTGATWLARQTRRAVRLAGRWEAEDLLRWILRYYWTKGSQPETSTSSHYLICWDGRIFQLTDEHLRVPHVGVSAHERRAYLDGSWARGGRARGQGSEAMLGPISAAAIAQWKAAWPRYASPQHLFPTRTVNDCSIGVEMPPCAIRSDGGWRYLAAPLCDGLHHTRAQHESFAALTLDVAQRWGWQGEWWKDPRGGPWSPRVAGHSDFDLYGRSSATGMWDPGGRRPEPWWDWNAVYSAWGGSGNLPGKRAAHFSHSSSMNSRRDEPARRSSSFANEDTAH